MLWHCTLDKDRTEMLSALLLLCVGVSTDNVMRNYILLRNRPILLWNSFFLLGIVFPAFRAPYLTFQGSNVNTD